MPDLSPLRKEARRKQQCASATRCRKLRAQLRDRMKSIERLSEDLNRNTQLFLEYQSTIQTSLHALATQIINTDASSSVRPNILIQLVIQDAPDIGDIGLVAR